MNNFSYVKISDIGTVTTGRTPKTSNANNYGNDYMFIGPTDLHKHFFITESERMVTQQGFDSIKSSTLNGTSVLVGCIGWDMGNVGIVDAACVTNQQINSITNIKDSYNPYYIYYWLKTKKDFLFSQATVTRTPILNKSTFSNIEIYIPSERSLQDGLVEILIAIDKKIELNNQINAELEAMAKTLYDYWFVQFDFPDADGKPYKSSGGKMVYNEVLKREIPEGWGDCSLGDITELYQPQTISEKEMLDEGRYLVYGANGIVGRYDQYNHEESVVTITCRGNSCGTINFTRPFSWITGNAMVVKPKSVLLVPDYILNLLSSSGVDNVITGSAQPQITRTNLSPLSVINPNQEMLKKYASIATNLFEKRICILEENEMLAKLRDWLLPMLMNGQVTVN